MEILVSYKYKGRNLVEEFTTNNHDMIEWYIEIGKEKIVQIIRESILDECLGWEKAQM